MYSIRLGNLGRGTRTLLDTGSILRAWKADRLWALDWCRHWKYAATILDCCPSRCRTTRHGCCYLIPQVCFVASHSLACLTTPQLRPKPWRDTRPCNCRNNNVSASHHIHIYFTNTSSNNIVASSISILNLSDSESRSLLSSPRTFLSKQSTENADRIRSVLIPAYQKGFRIIFIIGASLAALAFFLAYGLMPQLGLKRADDEALKKEGEKRMKGELDEEKRG